MDLENNNESLLLTTDCETMNQSYNNYSCQSELSSTKIFISDPEDMLNPIKNPVFYPIIITHGVTFLIGIIGNFIVIATWAGRGKLRSPTAAFLVSLAVADLLLLLIYVPLETFGYFLIAWDAGGNICKLGSYVEMLSVMSSVLNLVAVSFERFLVIVHPIRARRFCTNGTSVRGLIIVWVSAILLASPVLVTKKIHSITYYNNYTSITAYYCWDSDDNLALIVSIYQLLSVFILPALLMVICYFCVIQELWTSTKVIAAMTRSSGENSNIPSSSSTLSMLRIHHYGESYVLRWPSGKHHKIDNNSSGSIPNAKLPACSNNKPCRSYIEVRHARKQVIKMLILVIILFLLCWGPRLVINVLIKLGLVSYTQLIYTIRVGCYLLSFIHSALNPFVYGFMSSNFRRMMLHSCTSNSPTHASSDIIDHHLIGCHQRTRARRCSDFYEPTATTRICTSGNLEVDQI